MKYLIIISLLISTVYGQNINYYFQGQQPKDKVPCYNFEIISTTTLQMLIDGTGNIYWGDGDVTPYDGMGEYKTHTYSGSFTGTMIICGTITRITQVAVGSNMAGSIDDIPKVLTTYGNFGVNTVDGNISNFSSIITHTTIEGINTVTGDITNLNNVHVSLIISGNNTISGNIVNLPSTLEVFSLKGTNTTTGDLSDLQAGLFTFRNHGNNTSFGDINDLPSTITIYDNQGLNQCDTYTSGHTFSASITGFTHLPDAGFGLSETEVDNILIDLNTATMSSGGIDLRGNNAARSSASDAAVTALQGRGVTVNTN